VIRQADTPGDRLAALVDAVTTHRRRDETVRLEAAVGGRTHTVEYADRLVRIGCAADDEKLATLLDSFPVFKLKQPETRKAPDGVVYVSAIADPKHAAEFLEGVFRVVHGAEADYELRLVG
jgi:hypothetical protein